MLETEIHLFRYSAIPLFRIPPFPESPVPLHYLAVFYHVATHFQFCLSQPVVVSI